MNSRATQVRTFRATHIEWPYCLSLYCDNTLYKTKYCCTVPKIAAKITRHLPDTVNYQLCFDQSRTRIKFEYILIIFRNKLYRVYQKKTEQIGNRSQICKAAAGMKFLAQVHYFGTYDVE